MPTKTPPAATIRPKLAPLPHLSRALNRAALPAATCAAILASYRFGSAEPSILRDVIRAAFQNRHLTRDWSPWPRRAIA